MMDKVAFLRWVRSGYTFRFVSDGNHIDMYVTIKDHIPKTVLDQLAKQFNGELDWVGVDPCGFTEVKFKIRDGHGRFQM